MPEAESPHTKEEPVSIESSQEEPQKQPLTIGQQEFLVEIASTPSERQLGLMHRESMPANQGMLFEWEDEGVRTFWMKNTLIPLDMIWLDANKTIVDIKAAEPCTVEDCPTYQGQGAAKYVLELNQGVLRGQVGDKAEF